MNHQKGEMMQTKKNAVLKRLGVAVFAVAMVAFFAGSVAAEESPMAAPAAELQVTDCVKCHKKQPATITSNGGRHATAVNCIDCHVEHLPDGEDTIPQCSNCHGGESHFELENCLSCHSDPHEPLALNLADDIKEPCLTCHEGPGQDFEDYESAHAEQSCTFCHDVHGKIPDCADCHEPHEATQTTPDCLGCHPAHHPLQIEYAMTTPREFCAPCHEEPYADMDKTVTKHQNFTCAFCHRGTHPIIPQCQTCHGEPHSSVMHAKMPNCLDCHMSPHNLVK